MSSTPFHGARPWTPPEMDLDLDAQVRWLDDNLDVQDNEQDVDDSGYFGSAVRESSQKVTDASYLWPQATSPSQNLPRTPSGQLAPHTPLHDSRGLGISHGQRPYTPIKAVSYANAPRYPYTPDSARSSMLRSHTFHSTSPLPSMPWDSSPPLQASPVQDALFSCLHDLERLIQASQPNDDQMAYIVEQFEAMRSYLSAPEAQSKQSDDHLFSELVQIAGTDKPLAISKEEAEAYVQEVGAFVKAVQKHVGDMEQRLEEVKQLNSIQLEAIKELRQELHSKTTELDTAKVALTGLQNSLASQAVQVEASSDEEEEEAAGEAKEPVQSRFRAFWSAIGEALDRVNDELYEW